MRKRAPVQDAPRLAAKNAVAKLQRLQVLASNPEVLVRYHPARKIKESNQEAVAHMVEFGLRSEAAEAHQIMETLCGRAALTHKEATLHPECLGRAAVVEQVAAMI